MTSSATTRLEPATTRPAELFVGVYQGRAGYRTNLLLLASASVPPEVWVDPRWLASIGAKDGAFPVKIWCISFYEDRIDYTLMETVWVPANGGGYVNHPLTWLEPGESVGVEFTPAMQTYKCPTSLVGVRDDGGFLCGPLLSVIDNKSNDPTTIPMVMF